jgi:malate dehydrogenase (oxaloacetate-decarboxylating)(NADP+)
MEKHGLQILQDSFLNKGTAFTEEERAKYGLEGFLPVGIDNEEAQILRVKEHLSLLDSDLQKYTYLGGCPRIPTKI